MDWILALGGVVLIGIGIAAYFRPDLIWRLYSLEPRWRAENPEQPDDWNDKTRQQTKYYVGIGCISLLLSLALG